MLKKFARLTLCATLAGQCAVLAAQTTAPEPGVQEILEALRPKPAPVTPAAPVRKTRNLSVEDSSGSEPGNEPATNPGTTPATATPAPPSINLAIQFEVNSDHVRPASMKLLRNLAEAMQAPALRQARFLVEGHADGTGQPAYNLRLSALRAAQVKRVLVQHHVEPGRIVTEGKGSSELLNPTVADAPENRRVRIVLLEL